MKIWVFAWIIFHPLPDGNTGIELREKNFTTFVECIDELTTRESEARAAGKDNEKFICTEQNHVDDNHCYFCDTLGISNNPSP